jgi:hypothetical protein
MAMETPHDGHFMPECCGVGIFRPRLVEPGQPKYIGFGLSKPPLTPSSCLRLAS